MAATPEMKQGDLRPRYRVQLTSDGNPVDLTTATGVRFLMKVGTTGALLVDGVATIVDAATGIVEYAWVAGDTDVSGTYNIEFEVNWGGEKQTFPSSGYFTLTINDDLDP